MAVLLLGACSTIFGRSASLDYLDVEESPETQLPEGIDVQFKDYYPVAQSETVVDLGDKFNTPIPAALVLESDEDEQTTTLSEFRSAELNSRLEKDGAGTLIIRLDAPYAVSWARVADAIAASSIDLTDLNRSLGIYYLNLPNPEASDEKRSLWARIWSDPKDPMLIYQLKMNRADKGVYLSLQKDFETLAEEALTNDVLQEIVDQLNK
ncbi:MAG: outer membrane protein assembly factor BamC [Oleibacter sp.]|nr:outer membrane protein assembly factor BamC [Thalassolituus sp.]